MKLVALGMLNTWEYVIGNIDTVDKEDLGAPFTLRARYCIASHRIVDTGRSVLPVRAKRLPNLKGEDCTGSAYRVITCDAHDALNTERRKHPVVIDVFFGPDGHVT